jgi:hypothetical protein
VALQQCVLLREVRTKVLVSTSFMSPHSLNVIITQGWSPQATSQEPTRMELKESGWETGLQTLVPDKGRL